ncbi:3-oxoacyl-[acyl-carrier protein] reductase [Geomicrobium sp. JCM 19037]|uniref:SDR family NAD(P)-dependent oxidoreductase n=1 Tax=Geomicrobium sp. JCM 19037 TaxID=1460634 RepID=UPI00045F4B2A|nr:SDR family oxidoreductase [Geomicrobium sp. JCM 19037]GAK03637.1 3-oxoacyl-[acyl-carrier protein] reductase [Geomicrobium sp. JCM 19037]
MEDRLLSETLTEKVAIVTGSARGIGYEIAKKLLHSGAKVVIAGTDEERTKSAYKQLKALTEQEVIYFTGDLSNERNVDDLVQYTLNTWGKIDILINNAGGGVILPFLEQTPETLRTTIDRNLWTAVWCCYKVLPYMVENNYGRIVNVGADSVRNGLWDHAAYNAAKGGMHAMTTGLAREFAKYDITVNTIAPPAVDCEALDRIRERDDALVDKYIDIIPKGRAARMEEVADAVWYVSTEGASFITGQVISVNGGSNML